MKAIGKYIVIKPIKEVNTTTKGGLILADTQREDIRYREAKTLVIGDLVTAIKEGDKIYYDRHAGFNIEINNKTWKVIKEQDIVVVL